jgi:hypothetical protein
MLKSALAKVKALKGHFEYIQYQHELAQQEFSEAEKSLNGALFVEGCEGKPMRSVFIERYDIAMERLKQLSDAKDQAYQAWAEALSESVETDLHFLKTSAS